MVQTKIKINPDMSRVQLLADFLELASKTGHIKFHLPDGFSSFFDVKCVQDPADTSITVITFYPSKSFLDIIFAGLTS